MITQLIARVQPSSVWTIGGYWLSAGSAASA